jgi:hypothetical protein
MEPELFPATSAPYRKYPKNPTAMYRQATFKHFNHFFIFQIIFKFAKTSNQKPFKSLQIVQMI